MLYLVRKLNESIIINDNIEVKIVEIKGKSVKLGFEFPSSATILRKEVHDRVVAENLMAAANIDDIDDIDLHSLAGVSSSKLTLGGISDEVKAAAQEGKEKAGDNNSKSE